MDLERGHQTPLNVGSEKVMMKTALGLVALLCIGAAQAATPPQNRVDAFLANDIVTARQGAEVARRCDAALALGSDVQAALEHRSGPASIDGDFRPFDALYNLLASTSDEMVVLSSTSPTKAVRETAQACIGRIKDAQTQVSLSRPLYNRLGGIPMAGLDDRTHFVLARQLRDFKLAGVDRDATTRARVRALQKEIADASLAFDKNIAENRGEITLKSADDLQGLPQDYIDAHRPGSDGLIHISTDYPDAGPILQFAAKADVRKAMDVASFNHAWPANEPVLKRMLQKRYELAQVLGYDNYADFATADKMIGSSDRARAFLDQVNASATRAAQRDEAILLARERQFNPSAKVVPDWDLPYVQRLVLKEQYNLDSAEVRQYFTYDKTRAGIFQLIHDLFGADIRPWRTPVWNPDVSAWKLYEKNRLVGRFYLDMHPRDGKYTHAETIFLRRGLAGRQVPVDLLVCNFPATGPMSHRDVTVFLHEFGHLIHLLYSGHQEFALQSMDKLETDFFEAPSQMLEEWTSDYETLRRFATDSQGHPIPADLVVRMNAARHFGEAIGTKEQIAYSAIALDYHALPPGFDLTDTWRADFNRFAQTPYVEGTHLYASFGQLNDYSALYYTYVWSKAIALDMFTRFKQAGIRDPKVAASYRKLVLDPGAQQPAASLIRSFLGRDPNTAALEEELSAR